MFLIAGRGLHYHHYYKEVKAIATSTAGAIASISVVDSGRCESASKIGGSAGYPQQWQYAAQNQPNLNTVGDRF